MIDNKKDLIAHIEAYQGYGMLAKVFGDKVMLKTRKKIQRDVFMKNTPKLMKVLKTRIFWIEYYS